MPASDKKLILVIGATGAQGAAVIKALLAPDSKSNGPSPFRVRALTRDVKSEWAKELETLGEVELFQGNIHDLTSVKEAMQGCYGAYVNIDSFTVGEAKEMYLGMRIFEIAKGLGTLKHWVWSSLDYIPKKTGYNPKYKCDHYDAKGRVAEWLKTQDSDSDDGTGLIWSALSTGPYMESVRHGFGPVNKRSDGTYVFAAPMGPKGGSMPMIALSDIGFFARHIFDNPHEYASKDLKGASEMVSWPHLVSTFTKVTGKPAVYVPQTLEQYWDIRTGADRPVATDFKEVKAVGGNVTTFKENFSGWWNLYADAVIDRDMEMLRRINPNKMTLEKWIRETGYDGEASKEKHLKLLDDKSNIVGIDKEKAALL